MAAVFVTYHPDAGLYERVRALVGQVRAILIVDNGSSDAELAPVHRLAVQGVAQVILNRENRGQAAALNQGLAWANEREMAWAVTFDQDTTPQPHLVAAAGVVFERGRGRPLAVVGAGWIIPPASRPDCMDQGGIDVPWAVTSGSLHSVRTWRALGGFRESFFIDYVDIEYCLRARSAGYRISRVCATTMIHAYGNPTSRRILHRRVQPSNHNPARRYFNTRNRIAVWRAFWRAEPRVVAVDLVAWIKEMVKVVLFEDESLTKLLAIALGIQDAIRGVSGPLPRRRIFRGL